MYGLLLESVQLHIKQRYGQDAWEQLCKHCGLNNTVFATIESYSDTIIPKLSESCSKCLPCGLPADAYMEFFGHCFVDFTSTMGYSKVLKVYGRSFRDFLDNIDSLHEHLRFAFPKLMSPSFECKEETSDGLTLHYRSRRFGYKNYVIGQVKEVAKLYFNMDIEVKVLDEADILTSYGVRRCHITYRVIFNNSGFMPLVKEHRLFNSLSVPVDLIFSISPFSFLINKDLKIFRASSDLNQYFGENMAGKKVGRVFTVRRPPIELTWETLINHGRVIFELVARQASNISLFTDANATDSSDISARKLEWIEKLKRLGKLPSGGLDASSMPSKHKSTSTYFEKSIFRNNRGIMAYNGDRQRRPSLTISKDKPSRGIMTQRLRSNTVSTSKSIEKTEGATLAHLGNGDSSLNCSLNMELDEKCDAPLNLPHSVGNIDDNNITNESPSCDFIRPEPIGKQHSRDLSPSNSLTRIHQRGHEAIEQNEGHDIDDTGANMWYPARSLRRPEPIGQEDESKVSGFMSASAMTGVTDHVKRTSRNKELESTHADRKRKEELFTFVTNHATSRGIEQTNGSKRNGESVRSRSSAKRSMAAAKENNSIFGRLFQKRKIRSMTSCGARTANSDPIKILNIENADESGNEAEYDSRTFNQRRDRACTGKESILAVQGSHVSLNEPMTLCRMGFFSSIRRSVHSIRLSCFPALHVRNIKVGSAETGVNEAISEAATMKGVGPKKSQVGDINEPKASSVPIPRKSFPQKPVVIKTESNMEVKTDPVPRRRGSVTDRNQLDKGSSEERRKKVALWLQRQQYRPLHLRGQTKYISSWNMVLFIGTPVIGTVDDLRASGLFLSDLSMHDGSRFLTMQGTQRLSEIEFACDREKLKRDLLKVTTKKLEEEKRRTEEMLYSMMPREIAERMKNGDRELTTCETFDDVTILFGYVDDFTEICNKVEAMKVVQLVSQVFSLFDILSEEHKVYKFETIGGGVYMLVSGVPVKIDEHAREMALMSLAMLDKVQTLVNPLTNKPLELQIGIHSGPVVAGVIGQASLQYCLFGNTVNIASRMQTTGCKMKIHLSEATNRELECSEFITGYRGKVPVKGVGNLNTYWLMGRKENNVTNNNEIIKMKQCATASKEERSSTAVSLTS